MRTRIEKKQIFKRMGRDFLNQGKNILTFIYAFPTHANYGSFSDEAKWAELFIQTGVMTAAHAVPILGYQLLSHPEKAGLGIYSIAMIPVATNIGSLIVGEYKKNKRELLKEKEDKVSTYF